MLYQPKIPESLLRVVGLTAAGSGLVASSLSNATGTQAAAAIATGDNFSKWFEVKGRELTLLVSYTKGGETSVQFKFLIFGSGALPSRDIDYTTNTSQSGGVTATNTDQIISGVSYKLIESSAGAGNVDWSTVAIGATLNPPVAIPVHFGINNRATAANGTSLMPAAFPGRYARLYLVVAGTPDANTRLNVDLAWSGI
jgi:hypothetical protein